MKLNIYVGFVDALSNIVSGLLVPRFRGFVCLNTHIKNNIIQIYLRNNESLRDLMYIELPKREKLKSNEIDFCAIHSKLFAKVCKRAVQMQKNRK